MSGPNNSKKSSRLHHSAARSASCGPLSLHAFVNADSAGDKAKIHVSELSAKSLASSHSKPASSAHPYMVLDGSSRYGPRAPRVLHIGILVVELTQYREQSITRLHSRSCVHHKAEIGSHQRGTLSLIRLSMSICLRTT